MLPMITTTPENVPSTMPQDASGRWEPLLTGQMGIDPGSRGRSLLTFGRRRRGMRLLFVLATERLFPWALTTAS